MPNYELANTSVVTIPITLVNAVTGALIPIPAGETFTAASSSASLNAVIGATTAGVPALVVNALVLASPDITVTVSDSNGDPVDAQIFDIVAPPVISNIVLDLADATTATQAAPTAPGP